MRFKKIKKNSITSIYLRWLMLFTICVIGMFMTIYTVLELRLYSIVNIPAMSDLVKHIDDLKKDDFDSIPIERYKDARLIGRKQQSPYQN